MGCRGEQARLSRGVPPHVKQGVAEGQRLLAERGQNARAAALRSDPHDIESLRLASGRRRNEGELQRQLPSSYGEKNCARGSRRQPLVINVVQLQRAAREPGNEGIPLTVVDHGLLGPLVSAAEPICVVVAPTLQLLVPFLVPPVNEALQPLELLGASLQDVRAQVAPVVVAQDPQGSGRPRQPLHVGRDLRERLRHVKSQRGRDNAALERSCQYTSASVCADDAALLQRVAPLPRGGNRTAQPVSPASFARPTCRPLFRLLQCRPAESRLLRNMSGQGAR
eukprot:2044243-Pyramimonas_sp.AAC.2